MNLYEKMVQLPGHQRQLDALSTLKDGLEKKYRLREVELQKKSKNDFHAETMLVVLQKDREHDLAAIQSKIKQLNEYDSTKTMKLFGGNLIWDGINMLWRVEII